MVVLLMGERQW